MSRHVSHKIIPDLTGGLRLHSAEVDSINVADLTAAPLRSTPLHAALRRHALYDAAPARASQRDETLVQFQGSGTKIYHTWGVSITSLGKRSRRKFTKTKIEILFLI